MDILPQPPESCSMFRKVLNAGFSMSQHSDEGEVEEMVLQRPVYNIFYSRELLHLHL